MSLLRAKRFDKNELYRPFVSIIVPAYNEENVIGDKIRNLASLDYPQELIEFLVGSDGSNDRTVEIAKSYKLENLKVFNFPRRGKVSVINALLREAKGDILIFSDANCFYDRHAITKIVRHFVDSRIGCVSGQLRYVVDETSGCGGTSEGFYWRYENYVKVQESKRGRLSGANGAIYGIRRGILDQIEDGIINDDFYVSTYIIQAGYDVILDPDAIAYERPNDDFHSQTRRHIRDGAGHYQAILVFWRLLFPRKGSFVYISHRFLKWMVPFCFITAYICNACLVTTHLYWCLLLCVQTIAYVMLIFYHFFVARSRKVPRGPIDKLLSIVYYFMLVNGCLLIGLVRLIRGQQKSMWETQRE